MRAIGRKLRLVFADNSFEYDGNTPENKPLGGSHSALVYLTRELAALGHEVHVFNNCPQPAVINEVHFHRFAEIQRSNKYVYADAFIALRDPEIFSFWINAGARVLWAQDAFDQPLLSKLKANLQVRRNIDSIFCVSRWQAWTFLNHFDWPGGALYVTRNAICPDFFQSNVSAESSPRLVYTSTPFRGLELLLQFFPAIRASVPECELHVYSSMAVYQTHEIEDQKLHRDIYGLAEQPGVILHPSVGQRELAGELSYCSVMAYPNTFAETACIAVMEALAAGCAVVTSNLAALPESVGPGGVLIHATPGSTEYNRAFIQACTELLTNETRRQQFAEAGRDWILSNYTWHRVAQEWCGKIEALLTQTRQRVTAIEGWQPKSMWLD